MPFSSREVLKPAEGHVAQTPPRSVDDPEQRDVVRGVQGDTKIGEKILDLGALVELGAPDDPIRHALANEHVLDHPGLRVDPVEDGQLGRRPRLAAA